jgi:hypothetical protein
MTCIVNLILVDFIFASPDQIAGRLPFSIILLYDFALTYSDKLLTYTVTLRVSMRREICSPPEKQKGTRL